MNQILWIEFAVFELFQDRGFMKDIQAHLDKIRSDAAECLLLSSLATDGKREVFTGIAKHLNALAFELEETIATTETNKVGHPDREEPVAPDVTAEHPQKAAPPRRLLLLLSVVIFGVIVGALIWADSSAAEKYWSILQSKSPAPQDDTKQAMATLRSGEQADRRMLTEQVRALAVRVGDLERTMDALKKTEPPESLNTGSVGVQEKPPNTETKPSAPEEKPTSTEEGRTSTRGTPAATAAKQIDGHPPTSSDTLSEPADRGGAISPRRAELDPRKPSIGPLGCTQFRSFDPVSGTYTTLDGRRRQCR